MTASKTGSLVFMNDSIVAISSWMNSKVFRAMLSGQICSKAAKLLKNFKILHCTKMSPDLNPTEHAFQLLNTKLKEKDTNDSCCKSLAKHLKGENSHVHSNVNGFQTFYSNTKIYAYISNYVNI